MHEIKKFSYLKLELGPVPHWFPLIQPNFFGPLELPT